MNIVFSNSRRLRTLTGGVLATLVFGITLTGCGGGGGGSSLFNDNDGTADGDFVVEAIVPQQGQIWEVNRPITITFSDPVKFDTISPASIAIFQQGTNVAALGLFSLQNPRTVVYQPACPTSSAPPGLTPNGATYVINITSSTQSTSTTIQSSSGDPLKAGKTITFVTATATNPNDQFDPALFYDPKPSQAPLVSSALFTVVNSDGTTTETVFGNNAIIPGNKFVGPSVFFTLNFDQPLLPSTANINATNISLRFKNTLGTYVSIPSKVELIENCTATGSRVKITPLGLLPGGRPLRIVVAQSLTDIKGESNPFAVNVPFDSLVEPIVKIPASPQDFDAICENFDTTTNLDTNSGFIEPAAIWGNGELRASFSFAGQPTDFELDVLNGQTVIIDTTSATLQVKDSLGNPHTASFVNGNIFLRKLTVNNGGIIRGQGPNPLRFFVNETITISATGSVDVKGITALDVSTLLSAAAFPQAGGAGVCGGGDGGLGNPVTSQSCAQGGSGSGAFNALNGGGIGGESALVALFNGQPCFEVEDRVGAGGGGGSFTTLGEKGNDGNPGGFTTGSCQPPKGVSAVNPNVQPRGGAPGPIPFINNSFADNFFGAALAKTATITNATALGVVTVSDASFVGAADIGRYAVLVRAQPTQSWEDVAAACATTGSPENPATCFRSRIQVRRITAVSAGNIFTYGSPFLAGAASGFNLPTNPDFVIIYGTGTTTNGELTQPIGGQGGGGGGNSIQSTTFPNPSYANQDRKGGGGGGGGGIVEFRALGLISILGTVDASGGDGGAGENSINFDHVGGGGGGGSGGTIIVESASQQGASSITFAGAASGNLRARGGVRSAGHNGGLKDPVPPTTPQGMGHGGRGGKGLVQVHAPSPDRIAFFAGSSPASVNFDPAPLILTTSFGARSRARSVWFDTGSGLTAGLPEFSFLGICPPGPTACGESGEIITDSSGNVDTANPVVATNTLLVNATNLTANSITLPLNQLNVVSNPKAAEPLTLIKDLIRIGGNAGSIIAVSQPDSATVILTTNNGTTENPGALNAGISNGANATWNLVPRFFKISKLDPITNVVTPDFVQPDAQAAGNRVQITFQAANADVNGNVDINSIVPDPGVEPFGTSNLSLLTGRRFVRVVVSFDIATGSQPLGPTSFIPILDFLKLVFRFN
ncbi:MAG: hypothetical protein ACKVS6_14600 [Planctomycetota bacterium]